MDSGPIKFNNKWLEVAFMARWRQITHPTTKRMRKARKAERTNRRIGRLLNGRK